MQTISASFKLYWPNSANMSLSRIENNLQHSLAEGCASSGGDPSGLWSALERLVNRSCVTKRFRWIEWEGGKTNCGRKHDMRFQLEAAVGRAENLFAVRAVSRAVVVHVIASYGKRQCKKGIKEIEERAKDISFVLPACKKAAPIGLMDFKVAWPQRRQSGHQTQGARPPSCPSHYFTYCISNSSGQMKIPRRASQKFCQKFCQQGTRSDI